MKRAARVWSKCNIVDWVWNCRQSLHLVPFAALFVITKDSDPSTSGPDGGRGVTAAHASVLTANRQHCWTKPDKKKIWIRKKKKNFQFLHAFLLLIMIYFIIDNDLLKKSKALKYIFRKLFLSLLWSCSW